MFKEGRMPKNESFLGQLLNSMLAPDDEDISRKQIIDGSKLPDYSRVKQYMRPAGFKAYSVKDGWRIVGCVIAREKRAAARQAAGGSVQAAGSQDAGAIGSE